MYIDHRRPSIYDVQDFEVLLTEAHTGENSQRTGVVAGQGPNGRPVDLTYQTLHVLEHTKNHTNYFKLVKYFKLIVSYYWRIVHWETHDNPTPSKITFDDLKKRLFLLMSGTLSISHGRT